MSEFKAIIGVIVGVICTIVGIAKAVIDETFFWGILILYGVWYALVHLKNIIAIRKDTMSNQEIVIDENGEIDIRSDSDISIEDEMKFLRSLYEQKVITTEEYEKKRDEVLEKSKTGNDL